MATGNIQSVDTTSSLLSLLTALKGSSQTTTSGVSAEGVTALIHDSLGGTQGLAQLMQGQKSAGIYNSPTTQLLTNDLVTRTAANAAAANTTTTTKKNPQISTANIIGALGAAGLKSVLGPTVSGLTKKSGVDQWGNSIADTLGLGSGTNGSGFVGPPSDLAGGIGDSLASFGASVAPSTVDPADFGELDFGGAGADAVSDAASSAVSSSVGSAGVDAGADIASSVAGDATEDTAGSILGGIFG